MKLLDQYVDEKSFRTWMQEKCSLSQVAQALSRDQLQCMHEPFILALYRTIIYI